MKKSGKNGCLILVIILGITACQPQIINSTTLNSGYTYAVSKFSLRGRAEFPVFDAKANLTEVGDQATVSLLYPSNHSFKPNLTVATGLTDATGNFTINPSVSFNPANGEIFILKAVKRTGSAGNSVLTITTYIRWNGSGWDSITTNGIWLNTKTTALTIADHYNDSISPADCINKINTSGGTSIPSDVGTVSADTVNEIAGMVNSLLSSDEDPVRHIGYKNNKYYIINPVNPTVNYLLTYKKCPECDLRNENLSGIDLSGADLRGADLSGTSLENANLTGAELTGVILNGTKLVGALWSDGEPCSSDSVGGCYTENIIYVNDNATGNNDGTSWANAYNDLQFALEEATSGKDIWVAKGTYKPTQGTDRTISFQMKEGVGMYGGFAGTELRLSQRVLSAANESVLSGDLNNSGTANNGDSYNVLRGADNSVLDGFRVSYGYAGGAQPYNRGGGMLNNQVSPTVRNVNFFWNYGSNGGAVYNSQSNANISNTSFQSNQASLGGAVYNYQGNPVLKNLVFDDNFASTYGGAVFNSISSPIILNSVFYSNRAFSRGGAVLNSGASPALINNTLYLNYVMFPNSDSNSGGHSIYNESSSVPVLKNNIIISNSTLKGIFNTGNSSVKLTHSLISGGKDAIVGTVTNQEGIAITDNEGFSGAGNLNSDPLFVNVNNLASVLGPDEMLGTDDDGLKLQAGSPARNSGVVISSPEAAGKDILGLSRPQGSGFDMGAYEFDE